MSRRSESRQKRIDEAMGKMGAAASKVYGLIYGGLPLAKRMPKKRASLPYDPVINRWTGKPHEHKQEIARYHRQNPEILV